MASKKKGRGKGRPRNEYKGPFPINKDMDFYRIRKCMPTPTEGPTADMRSYSDSTISQYNEGQGNNTTQPRKRPRKVKSKLYDWLRTHIGPVIASSVIGLILTALGIIIYKYNVHFVIIDKDIEHIESKNQEQDTYIDDINKRVIDNTINVKLIQQRIDIKDNSHKK
ncbi:hypothetical protein [uncultured Alistipes sp.]|uniref:hypothetical protein n=1 Tax=uncultured Alistipes sp. TaxID=538949 RepID=UPI0025E317E5|nr:hypothetical protein [uncultured Alistipes sp.]